MSGETTVKDLFGEGTLRGRPRAASEETLERIRRVRRAGYTFDIRSQSVTVVLRGKRVCRCSGIGRAILEAERCMQKHI